MIAIEHIRIEIAKLPWRHCAAALLDRIEARAAENRAYADRLFFWLSTADQGVLRAELAAPFREDPLLDAEREGHAPFQRRWAALDSAIVHARMNAGLAPRAL